MALKDAPLPPTDADIQQQLGGAWAAYRELLDGQTDLRPEWKYYGAKYGWSLKLFAGKRNLCFIGARDTEFVVGFVFGDKDVARIMESELTPALKDELASSKQYMEGRALSITVRQSADLGSVRQLLQIKRTTNLRSRA